MLKKPAVASSLRRELYQKTPDQLGLPEDAVAQIRQADLRLMVDSERRIAVREEETVLMGYIDRVVLIYDGEELIAADVVDFKTDVLKTTKALDERIEFYRPQLEAYRRALAKVLCLPAERISARMLFADRGVVAVV